MVTMIMVTRVSSSPEIDHVTAVCHFTVQLPAINTRVTRLRELKSQCVYIFIDMMSVSPVTLLLAILS